MLMDAAEFLHSWPECWISARAAALPVVNVHVTQISAPPERVWQALESETLIAPRAGWRALLALREAIGKMAGWDKGLQVHAHQPLAPENFYSFFRIEHVAAPAQARGGLLELGLSVENKLTRAFVSFVVERAGHSSHLFNVTAAEFFGITGRMYWRVIRPFHDGITEAMLDEARRRAERR